MAETLLEVGMLVCLAVLTVSALLYICGWVLLLLFLLLQKDKPKAILNLLNLEAPPANNPANPAGPRLRVVPKQD